MLIEVLDGQIIKNFRPMPPSILEIKRFVAGYGDLGGDEGVSFDVARLGRVAVHSEDDSPFIGYANDDGFAKGMRPNCRVGDTLVHGPLLILALGRVGRTGFSPTRSRALGGWSATANIPPSKRGSHHTCSPALYVPQGGGTSRMESIPLSLL